MTAMAERFALKLAIGLGCILLLALLVGDRNRWKARAAHHAELLAAERAAHSASVANYRAAAERARSADAANAARVKVEQRTINERTKHEFEARIAAVRMAAGSVRRDQRTSAHSRNRGDAAVPRIPPAAGGIVETARGDGLSQSERLTATEQAIQLDQLIQWVRAQAAVEVSKD